MSSSSHKLDGKKFDTSGIDILMSALSVRLRKIVNADVDRTLLKKECSKIETYITQTHEQSQVYAATLFTCDRSVVPKPRL